LSLDPLSCPQNTRDQLRGVHDLTLEHDDGADDSASTRVQPPLVSCIALFDSSLDPASALMLDGAVSATPHAIRWATWYSAGPHAPKSAAPEDKDAGQACTKRPRAVVSRRAAERLAEERGALCPSVVGAMERPGSTDERMDRRASRGAGASTTRRAWRRTRSAQPLASWAGVRSSVRLAPLFDCLSNTRDQLRGAHDRATVHDERSGDGAATRLQPPLVSCIALLGDAIHSCAEPSSCSRNAAKETAMSR
jgi:hypothetical protein